MAELADPIVRRHVVAEAARAADRREPVHPLVTALVTEEPLETGSHRVAGALDEWRTSLTVGEPELVLRLAEPDDEDPARESAAVDALWPLEVCLRMEGEAPQPVPIHGDPALVRLAGEKVTAAVQAYPRLRDLPRDPRGMDFLLPTQVVQDLVAHGAQALRSAGVHLLLPRSWRIVAPTMRVQVASPAATETAVGLSGLVSYRWELALGDTVLTPAEMSRLVQAKSDLVRLRGQWVQADHRMLAAAAAYLQGRTDETVGTMGQLLTEIAASGVQRVPLEEVTATGWAAELFAATRTPDRVDPPAALKAELRPHPPRHPPRHMPEIAQIGRHLGIRQRRQQHLRGLHRRQRVRRDHHTLRPVRPGDQNLGPMPKTRRPQHIPERPGQSRADGARHSTLSPAHSATMCDTRFAARYGVILAAAAVGRGGDAARGRLGGRVAPQRQSRAGRPQSVQHPSIQAVGTDSAEAGGSDLGELCVCAGHDGMMGEIADHGRGTEPAGHPAAVQPLHSRNR
ncbi:hypothetical protein AWN90_16985 [Nocardia terpenica]|uniref:DUF3670 domain-containing protein n=1 Tax=Nocardia terpenica TaxID=455432 RepID=A0A164PSD5_9NOCA|nr:hypothetical protein AWN90_16985 [Nocardia terpenica]